MNVLVVGGAGYIGSHMVKMLASAGHHAVVMDNFSTGFREAVVNRHVVESDFGDRKKLEALFLSHRFSAVMHFASYSQVAESMQEPARYYCNNVGNTATLLDTMRRFKVNNFIFSSTAAVYGEPRYRPLDEDHPAAPINPYGRTKLMVEQMLKDFEAAYGMRYASLRYFNAAGADPDGELGERHHPETHLIPLIVQVASGRRESVRIFGRDYATPDGTCIRDFVHVEDLCQAHLQALQHLLAGGASGIFNLGNGQGYSVQEVVAAVERVTGKHIPVIECPRRAGDPEQLVADATRARSVLGWQPRHTRIDDIVRHAWQWELQSADVQQGLAKQVA